jgi:hypothetical protein
MYKFLLKTYVVLILATVSVVVWLGFLSSSNSAEETSAQVQPKQTETKEAMNAKKLDDLFVNADVRLDEAAILPAQIERSQTIIARLQSSDNLDSNEFSEQMAESAEVSLVQLKKESGALSRQRVLELSQNQIMVVAINAQKQVLWWNLQPDPRVFRAETSDDAGNLSGKTLYRNDSEILFSIPADAAINEVRFYHPVWDGTSSYSLQQIGRLNLEGK